MAERAFAIRLSAKGMEQTRAALKGMGADGAAALREIDKANRQVTPGLKAVDSAARDVRAEFERFADQVPVIGGSLKALGPAGIAAGAGLAALGGAAYAMWDAGQKAREALDALKTSADNIGTSAETFQVLQAAALEADINVDKLTEAMGKLQLSAALASKGKGELAETLKKLNPELLKEIALAETQEDRWNVVSRAITAQTSQVEKIIIAKAAFGEQGGKLVRLLDGEDKLLEALTARYKELGLVIDEGLVASIAEADRRMDLANKRMEIDGIRAGAAMLPVVESLSGAWTGLNIAVGTFFDRFNPTDQQQITTVEQRIADLNGEIERLRDNTSQLRNVNRMGLPNQDANTKAQIEALKRQRELLEMAVEIRKFQLNKGPTSTGTEMGETPEEKAERERLAAELARKQAEALREQQALEKASIALRKDLGDWTGVYAQREAELTKLVGQYGVTQDMVNTALARYRAELDGSAEAQARWASQLDALVTPVQKAQQELRTLWDDFLMGALTVEQFNALLPGLNKNLDEAAAAAVRSRDGASGLAESFGTAVSASKDMRAASFELNFALETTDAIYRDQMRSLRDLEDVALDVFYNMAISAIQAQSQIKGSGLLDFLTAAASPILGAFGLGGAPGAGNTGGNASSSSGGSVVTRRMHGGGQVGDPSLAAFHMPIAPFINAPRFHTGFAPDEFPTVLQKDERVFSARHNERIVRAIEGGGASAAPKVELHFHGVEKQPEVKQTQQPNGDIRIDVMLEKKIVEVLGSNKAHAPMRKNFGLFPAAGV